MHNWNINGFLNIEKPYGITSMEVIRRIKRVTNQKKIGHGGTLDPNAVGVLPICFGQATRLMNYLINGRKEYRAVIELGLSTDTYDSAGKIVKKGKLPPITKKELQDILKFYVGTIEQIPPMYSALKKEGRRLYEYARDGIEVDREPRVVEVFDITMEKWQSPLLTINIQCGRGFYVRSIAYDIGENLGCGAYLKDLTRIECGTFHITDSIPLSDIENQGIEGKWRTQVYPLDFVLKHLNAMIIGNKIEDFISNGRFLTQNFNIPSINSTEDCRVYSLDGRFIGLVNFDSVIGQWKPAKVFSHS